MCGVCCSAENGTSERRAAAEGAAYMTFVYLLGACTEGGEARSAADVPGLGRLIRLLFIRTTCNL